MFETVGIVKFKLNNRNNHFKKGSKKKLRSLDEVKLCLFWLHNEHHHLV